MIVNALRNFIVKFRSDVANNVIEYSLILSNMVNMYFLLQHFCRCAYGKDIKISKRKKRA